MKHLAAKIDLQSSTSFVAVVTRLVAQSAAEPQSERRPRESAEARRQSGVGDMVVVRTTHGELEAVRAASCLVSPEVGDEVLVAAIGDGRAFVLAVLVRAHLTPTLLEVEGDLSIRTKHGRVDIAAQEGVGLTTAKGLSMTAAEVDMTAVTGRVGFEKVVLLAGDALAQLGRLKVDASTIDTVAERLSQKLKRYFRVVDEIENVKTRYLNVLTSKTMRLHAENAVLTADQLVKMDGEQIHVG